MTDAVGPLRELLDDILTRLATLEGQAGIQPSTTTTSSSKTSSTEVPRSVRAFDQHIQEHVAAFVGSCQKLGSETAALGDIIQRAWAAQRTIILTASQCQKPAQAESKSCMNILSPLVQECQKMVQRGEWENHQRAVVGGLGCVSWVLVEPAPTDFVENFIGESDFYSNKIRVQFKGKNEDQIAFCSTLKEVIRGLMTYVKEHHTTGLSWNPRGGKFSASMLESGSESKEEESKSQPAKQTPVVKTGSGGSNALLSELNKAGGVTSGLKKVTKEQQTWRSEYKAQGSVPVAKTAPTAPKTKTSAPQKVRGPPSIEFSQAANKWAVDNQTKEQGVVELTADNVKHTVYIYNCDDATINITGKFKSLIIDSCVKTRVLFDSVISSCELVNCKRMQVQVRNAIPSIAIDKTDGCLVYLSRESLGANFITSKSSEMNVSFPNENDEMIEVPIPEQFVHNITMNNGSASISSNVSDLYS